MKIRLTINDMPIPITNPASIAKHLARVIKACRDLEMGVRIAVHPIPEDRTLADAGGETVEAAEVITAKKTAPRAARRSQGASQSRATLDLGRLRSAMRSRDFNGAAYAREHNHAISTVQYHAARIRKGKK